MTLQSLPTAEFFGTPVQIIDHNGQRWLTAQQAGLCLGYAEANARIGIQNLYNRHLDRFDEGDTTVIKLMTVTGEKDSRIFSATGCITLGWLANTKKAVEFQRWAKQVLARELEAAPAMPVAPIKPGKTPSITRSIERQVFELFVAGHRQKDIATRLRISAPTVNLLLLAKYQFSPAAGAAECTPELIAAVAARHLAVEQARLLEYQQRVAQRFCHSSHNQLLASQMDRAGQQFLQASGHALLPPGMEGGAP